MYNIFVISHNLPYNSKLLSLEVLALNKINDLSENIKFVSKLKNFESNNKTGVYLVFLEYYHQKFEQYSYTKLLNYLKSVAIPKVKSNYVFWLYEEEKNEYLNLCFELGKYKEAVRFMIKCGEFNRY